MTIALDTEIVASAYDPGTRICSYTIEREGKRWTVKVPMEHFEKHGNLAESRQKRRNHLATLLQQAMNGPPDAAPERPKGTEADPHRPSTWEEFKQLPSGQWFINPADGTLQQVP